MLLYKSAVFALCVVEQVNVIFRVLLELLGLSSAKHAFLMLGFSDLDG